MKLIRPAYQVAYYPTPGGDLVESRVEITPGDQMRGEMESRRQGIGTSSENVGAAMREYALSFAILWVWSALVREKLYSGSFQDFAYRDLYAYEPTEEEDASDPTPAAPSSTEDSAPALPSPATTETPVSG